MDQSERGVEAVGYRGSSILACQILVPFSCLSLDLPLCSSGVRADDNCPAHIQVCPDPAQRARFGVEIVYGHVEEALDLAGVQIHCYDMVAAGGLEHIGHELGRDWRSGLVLFVLSGIGKVGDHCCNATGRGSLAGRDDDQQLHYVVVDVTGSCSLNNEDCSKSQMAQWLDRFTALSSSRTDSPIVTEVSWFEYWSTIILVRSIPRLFSCQPQLVSEQASESYWPETNLASSGWLLPVRSLIEFDDMAVKVARVNRKVHFEGEERAMRDRTKSL